MVMDLANVKSVEEIRQIWRDVNPLGLVRKKYPPTNCYKLAWFLLTKEVVFDPKSKKWRWQSNIDTFR